jgi:membrane protein YqaA with SNARE-associated domain
MVNTVVGFVTIGFTLSMLLFFVGQGCRFILENGFIRN